MKYKITFFLLKIWNFYVYLFLKCLNNKYVSSNNINFKKIKILLVKPYTYLDIYSLSFKNPIKTFFSSIYRFGPVGLLVDNNADFCIVNSYDGKKINYKHLKKNDSRLNFLKIQKKQSTKVASINFNDYDIVVSFENTLSDKLTALYPKVLWGKFYEDHKNPDYIKSIFKKPKGFDLVLNQTLGFTPYSFFRKSHWIDFSYTFGSSNFLNHLNLQKKKKLTSCWKLIKKNILKHL